MKCLNKIALVIKTAGNGSLFNGNVFRGKHFTGTFDPVVIQIINRGSLSHAAEIPTEVFGVHASDFRQTVEADVIIIILGDIGKDIFNGIKLLGGFGVCFVFLIKMVFEDNAKPLLH